MTLYQLITAVISNVLNVALIKKLLDGFLQSRDGRKWATAVGYTLFYLATSILACLPAFWSKYGALRFLPVFLLSFLYQDPWDKRLWISAAIGSVEYSCCMIGYFLCAGNPYIQTFSIGSLLFLLCYAVIQRTAGSFAEETDALGGKQTLLLLLIPMASFAATLCVLYGNMSPPLASAACCLCILAVNLSVFYLYGMLLENHAHERQRDVYRQQTQIYRNQLELIGESQGRMRSLRHDMKNHILHLQAELQQGRSEEALAYLEKMSAYMLSPSEYVSSGNAEIDSLLNYKIHKAKQVLDKVEVEIKIPSHLALTSFDVNVILGNLLDNAIQAAVGSGKKWLELFIRADRGILLIRVANSYSGPIKKTGRKFDTTRQEGEKHGLGLDNVRRMVEELNGDIEIEYSEDAFRVEVMLYINRL